MKVKRILAYLIDLFIISFIVALLFRLPMFEKDYDKFDELSNQEMELIFSGNIDNLDEDGIYELEYQLNRASLPMLIIRVGVLLLYFGVFQYIWNGQTLGKRLMNIKIAPNTGKVLNPGLFIIRSVLVSNMIPSILNILALIFFGRELWIISYNFIGNFQFVIMGILYGFVIFREDERGLHDILCNTKVISKRK